MKMQYMGNSDWWNNRFKRRELKSMAHEKSLEEDIGYLRESAEILDVACGDGRNSLYLSRQGYKVHAIDFSEEALNRLRHFAKQEDLNIETSLVDLSSEDAFHGLKKYDAVIINHYRLNPDLYNSLVDHLNNNGVLWVNGFREVPCDNPNIKESDIFLDEDFNSLNCCELREKKLYEVGQRKFVKYIFLKNL